MSSFEPAMKHDTVALLHSLIHTIADEDYYQLLAKRAGVQIYV